MDQSWPLFFIFVRFTSQLEYKLKKRRCRAWDSNPWLQDGKCRWIDPLMYGSHLSDFTKPMLLFDFTYGSCCEEGIDSNEKLDNKTKDSKYQSSCEFKTFLKIGKVCFSEQVLRRHSNAFLIGTEEVP